MNTVHEIAEVCGADPADWVARRARIARAAGRSVPSDAEQTTDTSPAREPRSPKGTPWRREIVVGIVVAAFVAGGGLGALVDHQLSPRSMPLTGKVAPATGIDPGKTACVFDAQPAHKATDARGSTLELMWSDNCQAGWARLTRNDGDETGNSITVITYLTSDPEGASRQAGTVSDAHQVYSNMVVRADDSDSVCAEGKYTDGGNVYQFDPVCL